MATVIAMLLTGTLAVVEGATSSAVHAATTDTLKLTTPTVQGNISVVDTDTGAPVPNFKFIINVDNTGTTEQRSPSDGCSPESAGYPDTCNWTSMGIDSQSPIFTQGDQSDLAAGLAGVPAGRYLISVLADGYKLDGQHFTMPLDETDQVVVELEAPPLPDATVQAAVFEDISPVNGAPDLPAEHGLAGFSGVVRDTLGELTTNVYGAPLCGTGVCLSYCYVVDNGTDIGVAEPTDSDGRCPNDVVLPNGDPRQMYPLAGHNDVPPIGLGTADYAVDIPTTAAIEGKIKIPNLGTNRYTLTVTPPDGTGFIQTTTLEGNHDWDSWVMEGATGLDTEFVVAGEPFPAIIFGYVPPSDTLTTAVTGEVKGIVEAYKSYVPAKGGVIGGEPMTGAKVDKPVANAWVSLSDLDNGDTAVWTGQADANGVFDITGVPDGNYTITWWDEPQDYILGIQNVTVSGGEVVDLGLLPLNGWWTTYSGYVFNDTNRNGKMDWTDTNHDGCPQAGEGETGVPNFGLTMRRRENTLMDRGTTAVSTDACGFYYMESAYPITQWLVMEAYNDLYYTTGVTYQADNQPDPTTVVGAGVDVSTLPIIGLSGTLDWGVHSYDPRGTNGVDPQNGGIVGTVSYDTTRNELDPRYAAVEDWQPGVPNMRVELYEPVPCDDPLTQTCDADGNYQLGPDGSYLRDPKHLINTYQTETWQMPGQTVLDETTGQTDGDCVPRDVDGNELLYPSDQQITKSHSDCLEAPLMGIQFQNGYSTVDGNYGFGDGCFSPNHLDPSAPTDAPVCLAPDGTATGFDTLPGASDYLVHVVVPDDPYGKPLYNFTKEEDINIGNGDEFYPSVPPPACVGALHTVDVADMDAQGDYRYLADGVTLNPAFDPAGDSYQAVTANGVTTPASTPVDSPTLVDLGGSPYEGMEKPSCDTKLVPLANGRSTAPLFNVFTAVPVPTHFWGLIVDDLNFSTDPKQINYGEKAGVPFAPVGIYDHDNRLVYTTESDYGGLFDTLLPSTNRISCPTPSGVCANVYRFVGNDPGVPGRLNTNYKPDYRTIAAEFEAMPGNTIPADLAPTQVGVSVQLPGGQAVAVQCSAPASVPQLFAVDKPYVLGTGQFTIKGLGFGQSPGKVTLDESPITVDSWSDSTIKATVPSGAPVGPHQLRITTSVGLTPVNTLTFHVLGSAAAPFPSTAVIDNFNRNNNNFGFGLLNGWAADTPLLSTAFAVANNQARVQTGNNTYDGWRRQASFGTNQEAYFTFTQPSNQSGANEQGLLLKYSGGFTPQATAASWIEVAVNNTPANTVRIRTKSAGSNTITDRATLTGVTFAPTDKLGARAQSDGTIIVYKNGIEIGRTTVVATGPSTGTIGVRFEGTGTTAATEARFDDFGGGNVAVASGGYTPNLYEVGQTTDPNYTVAKATAGRWFTPVNSLPATADHAIQNALDAAAASPGDDLVVVYPGPTANDRTNPRGAYYENLIVTDGVKLQGVGAGSPDGSVPGSIIDGSAFGGDSPVATDWYAKISDPAFTWDGNDNVNDGAVISIYTHDGDFTAGFKASIDGFDLRGGDQMGFPNNLNEIGGGSTGLPPNVVTQGGAIFANAYARNLQITNNVVQNNGGSYGTIRIGTPDIGPTPNHNENVRIANNRIIANAGTNLAGAIGLFDGSDGYTVSRNDVCGNFSAEYGGGISAFGLSPGGTIDHNRLWFNRSYDEGGGIMIAGSLPSNPDALSPGSGAVSIHDNVIQSNLADDDGGGIRFLMAGNFPMDVYNNMITNNVSTHEGGGVALDDAPNVRFFNNTVMKNVTTATAVTSNGSPAPAGLSTGTNSTPLQNTLPPGAPTFSNPLLFNNIFWDNRAGARGTTSVTGIGAPGDATPINNWDMGLFDGGGVLSPTNSVLQTTTGTTPSPTNTVGVDPNVKSPYDTVVAFDGWRTNPAFIGAILVSLDLPPDLLGDYHIQPGSSAIDRGATSSNTVNAPVVDIDGDTRPAGGGVDAGADELPATVPTPPPAAFPASSVLDNFNRANSSNLGGNWPGSNTGYRIDTSTLEIRGSAAPPKLWSASFGANEEAYFTFSDVATLNGVQQGLVLKSSATGDSMIRVTYDRTASTVTVATVVPGGPGGVGIPTTIGTIPGVSLVNGNTFGARVVGNTVTVYRNNAPIGTSSTGAWTGTGNRLGIWFSGTTNTTAGNARIDNFGGGTLP